MMRVAKGCAGEVARLFGLVRHGPPGCHGFFGAMEDSPCGSFRFSQLLDAVGNDLERADLIPWLLVSFSAASTRHLRRFKVAIAVFFLVFKRLCAFALAVGLD